MSKNRLLDQILVCDIEATCWASNSDRKGQPNEIIEVGIVPIHAKTGTVMVAEKRCLMVRPERSKVGTYCTNLTSITPEQAMDGMSFRDACNILFTQYQSKRRIWASWGDFDRNQFVSQCNQMHVPYPFGDRHINVKSLFAIMYNLDSEIGMTDALDMLKLELEGTHHRGVDDAYNIARIFSIMLKASRQSCTP